MATSILFTIPNFITAGSGRALLNVIERLDPRRFSPGVCVARKGGRLDQEVERLGIPFLEAPFTIPARPYRSLLRRAREVAKPFQEHGFQIWHSFHYGDDYTEPIIARCAGARAWVYTKKNMNWRRRSWHVRSLLATRIAAQNEDMLKDFFSAPWYRRKTRLVRRGVDINKFAAGVPARLNLRSQLGISPVEIVVVCVAHLVPVKGHPTLIASVSQIPRLRLLIAGSTMDRAYRAALDEQVMTLGVADRVHFLGGVDDVPALLAECDIAVLPTWGKWRGEGCPVALLEAMASGRACIATDVPGARELIVDGQCGLLVAPEDVDGLTAALQRLATDGAERQRFGSAARLRVEQYFSISREVDDHQRLYAELVRPAHDD
jgi:glycosyltransferase involved in cell wall biosynthesis